MRVGKKARRRQSRKQERKDSKDEDKAQEGFELFGRDAFGIVLIYVENYYKNVLYRSVMCFFKMCNNQVDSLFVFFLILSHNLVLYEKLSRQVIFSYYTGNVK